METAGMQVALGADYSQFEAAFMQANKIVNDFNQNVLKNAAGIKDALGGLSGGTINFNADGFTKGLSALISSSDDATKSIVAIVAQVETIPSAFQPSTEAVVKLAQALSSLNSNSGGAIGGNSFTSIADVASNAAASTKKLSASFTAADASAETFVTGSVQLSNSLETNVSILNLYKDQLAQVQAQIKEVSASHAGSTQSVMAQTQAVDQLGAQQAILKQQISQANTVINAQAKEMIAADDSYRSLQNNLTLTSDAFRRLSAEDREGIIGQEMLANIQTYDTELKKIDATMGQSQRNVGNYGSAFSGLRTNLNRTFHGLADLLIAPDLAMLILARDIPNVVTNFQELSKGQKVQRELSQHLQKLLIQLF